MKIDWSRRLLPAVMATIAWTNRRRLLRAARNVEATQLSLLQSILAANQGTRFGLDHGFSSISDWDSYRAKVPIQSFASLEPYIQRQIETRETALVAAPLVSLARTSGTTGPTKDIPMTAGGLANIKDAQRQLALTLFRKTRFFDGRILALFSPHVEGRLRNGLAYGASSGQANQNTPMLFRSKYVYPSEIATIGDYDLKYYLYSLFGILEKNVTGIATANPSSICRLAEIINERRSDLKADLQSGDISRHQLLPGTGLVERFSTLCRMQRSRVDEVLMLLDGDREIRISDLWPSLSAAAVWTGGSCTVALGRLRGLAGPQTKFVELGYRASEFIGSINIDAVRNLCLPALQHTVFEFVEQTLWEAGEAAFTPMSELRAGVNYYVFVTTSSGLYRYDINDVIRVSGHHHGCPTITFLQKGKGVTSITGEKLYAHQAMTAVADTQRCREAVLEFCLLLADEAAARYDVLIEAKALDHRSAAEFAGELDESLMKSNLEYSEKRRSGRLKEPRARLLKAGAGEAIKRHAIANGQRETQYKPLCLEYASKFDFQFGPWLQGEPVR